MTRGVLIDVAALKGVDMRPDTYEITVQDLQQALQRQSLTLQPGDAVVIHTGWGKLWARDNARFMKGCPGSASPPLSGSRARIRCWSARTISPWRFHRIRTLRSRCPFTRSCS